MPLVVIVGLPSSGKTTRAKQIKEQLGIELTTGVYHISENDILQYMGLSKNAVYMDSSKEKELRGILKSQTLRLLNPQNVVIVDAGNYIKGYRYELYCAAKNSRSTQVTIETICSMNENWDWNMKRPVAERYSQECFDALRQRYEAPDSRNRWDSPLFCLQSHEKVPAEAIYEALFLSEPPPPNQSTETVPLSNPDFLHELDKITQNIVGEILAAKKCGAEGSIQLSCHGGLVLENLPPTLTPSQLARYRRQFLNYTKLHPPSPCETPDGLAQLFARFLHSSFGGGGSKES